MRAFVNYSPILLVLCNFYAVGYTLLTSMDVTSEAMCSYLHNNSQDACQPHVPQLHRGRGGWDL